VAEAENEATAVAVTGPRIAVIVCSHNRYETLGDTLRGLEAQTLPEAAFEVVVVDNSTDLDAQKKFWRLNKLPANVRLIRERIPGLSRARNIGFRAAAAPIVAYIDDDAVASPGWLGTLLDVFETTEKCGVAGGPVVPVWLYPAREPEWLHQWQRGFLTIVDRGPGRRALGEGEWLAGTNIAFRRDLLEKVGGFNEGLGRIGNALLSNEELEVSRKIEAEGFGAFYDDDARVLHRVHANRVSQGWFRRRVSWQAVSDQMSGGRTADDEACWARIHQYLQKVPVEMRGVRGLFLNTNDPDLFHAQCGAIEALVTLLTASGRDPEARAPEERAPENRG
jgi:glycosyltransferase involved in cell wall biosynthesis